MRHQIAPKHDIGTLTLDKFKPNKSGLYDCPEGDKGGFKSADGVRMHYVKIHRRIGHKQQGRGPAKQPRRQQEVARCPVCGCNIAAVRVALGL